MQVKQTNEDLEQVNCVLCGNEKMRHLFTIKKFNIVKCAKCSLVFTNPRIKEKKLNLMYDENYFVGKGFDETVDYYGDCLCPKKETIFQIKYKLSEIKKIKKKGKLLDVGCAFGLFLDFARKKGFVPYGLELSKHASKEGKKLFNINIQQGTLSNCKFKKNLFDVITLTEVIEHLHNPLRDLQNARGMLKDDGVLVIQTGNIDSLKARYMRRRWDYFTLPGHIYYFSKRTIAQLLEEAGFCVIKIYPPNKDHPNSRIFTKVKKLSIFEKRNSFFRKIMVKTFGCILDAYENLRSSGIIVFAKKNNNNLSISDLSPQVLKPNN